MASAIPFKKLKCYDSQKELERLTAFVGIVAEDLGAGQGSSRDQEKQ
ncbi:MAG: hypothetical protein H6Q48_912 [Deltaproteobacteria bacterium]|jgi:hypothetical protein|nr:hypothetical protein [Deltaproteobacteria bacterium]